MAFYRAYSRRSGRRQNGANGQNRPVRKNRPVRRGIKNRAALALCMTSAVVVVLFLIFNIAMVPVLKTAAVYKAQMTAVNIINNSVGVVLEEDNISYDKLVSFDKDSGGYITAIKSDTLQINLLKYDITKEVISELKNAGSSELKIPLGTIIGGQLLTGRGPFISIRFSPVGNVNSQITSSFSSAGINQTRQQIMLEVTADITVMMSSYNVSTQVKSNYCIADSIIVGNVPGSYTVVDGTNDTSNKIFTYGSGRTSDSTSSGSQKSGK